MKPPFYLPLPRLFSSALALVSSLCMTGAQAWGNHTLAAYRAFEAMPEVATAAPVAAEPLEVFLKAQEKPIEALLKSQEDWAVANINAYPPRPATLAFTADAARSDDARRLAFLRALRVAPNSKFALYFEMDPKNPVDAAAWLKHEDINTLPASRDSPHKYAALKAGEMVAPLKVLASASFEPDYGLDINVWSDSPSDWGKVYGFGALPFGNPKLSFSTQAPFHMGFYYEDRILYMAAPFLKRTFPMLRANQYSGLAALAFRTGHPYWGWRFTGLALHYVQDLTQPYHANLSPGSSTLRLLWVNALSMAGFPKMRDETVTLLSNRHLALERYQGQILQRANQVDKVPAWGQVLNQALSNSSNDAQYPPWSDVYIRDVIARESYDYGAQLAKIIVDTLPAAYVSDPAYDFGANEEGIDLVTELAKLDEAKRAALDASVTELMGRFGAHSRNAVRGILKAAGTTK